MSDYKVKPISKSSFKTMFTPYNVQTRVNHSNSPEAVRNLYSTGFIFKNSNSPIACDIRMSPAF